jgi:hypothetical protein
MSPKKIELLKKLQELENKWSSELMTHGGVHTGMTKLNLILSLQEMRLNIRTYKKTYKQQLKFLL